MFGFGRKEAATVVTIEVESDEEISEEEETSASNCAWCGDPPNEYGSHGICSYHAAQLIEAATERRRSKRGY